VNTFARDAGINKTQGRMRTGQSRQTRAKRAREAAPEVPLKRRRVTAHVRNASALRIQRWWSNVKTVNQGQCPITLQRPDIRTRFTLVHKPSGEGRGARYATCALALAEYFIATLSTRCPLTRRDLTALEILRLHKRIEKAASQSVEGAGKYAPHGFAPALWSASQRRGQVQAAEQQALTYEALQHDATETIQSAMHIAADTGLPSHTRSRVIINVLLLDYEDQVAELASLSPTTAAAMLVRHRRMLTEHRLRLISSSPEDLARHVAWHEQRAFAAAREAVRQQETSQTWPFTATDDTTTSIAFRNETATARAAYESLYQVSDRPETSEALPNDVLTLSPLHAMLSAGVTAVHEVLLSSYASLYGASIVNHYPVELVTVPTSTITGSTATTPSSPGGFASMIVSNMVASPTTDVSHGGQVIIQL